MDASPKRKNQSGTSKKSATFPGQISRGSYSFQSIEVRRARYPEKGGPMAKIQEMRDAIVIHHYIIRAGHRDEPNFHLSNTVDGVPTTSGSSPTLYSNTSSTMHF